MTIQEHVEKLLLGKTIKTNEGIMEVKEVDGMDVYGYIHPSSPIYSEGVEGHEGTPIICCWVDISGKLDQIPQEPQPVVLYQTKSDEFKICAVDSIDLLAAKTQVRFETLDELYGYINNDYTFIVEGMSGLILKSGQMGHPETWCRAYLNGVRTPEKDGYYSNRILESTVQIVL